MKRVAIMLVFAAACSEDVTATTAPVDYTLHKVRAFAGEHKVVGLDADGDGGVWLAYQMQSAAFDYDDLRLVHLDYAGTKLVEHRYTESTFPVSGIALADDALWINYTGNGVGSRLRKVDAVTGAELASLPIEYGIEDITMRDSLVVLSSIYREFIAFDPQTGTEQWRTPIPELADSESRGIATARDGQSTWVVSIFEGRVVRVDDMGAILERAGFPFSYIDDVTIEDGMHLAVDGTKLVLHRRNQITWYERR
jgi:outer membrane protein assembly factor BamB